MPIDPLNVSQIITTLITTTGHAIIGLNNLVSKYRDAPLILTSIRTETSLIRVALSHTYWILNRGHDVQTSFSSELKDTIDVAINGCMVTFAKLEQELKKLTRVKDDSDIYDWRDKFRYLYNEDTMVVMLDQMRGLAGAINVVLSALQTETQMALIELLIAKRPTIERVRESWASAQPSDPNAADSESKSTSESRSIFVGPVSWQFEFDKDLLSTDVYRRAMEALLQPSAILKFDDTALSHGKFDGSQPNVRETTSPEGNARILDSPSNLGEPTSAGEAVESVMEEMKIGDSSNQTPEPRLWLEKTNSSVDAEPSISIEWDHQPRSTFSFIRISGAPLWTRPLEVKLLVLDDRPNLKTSLTRGYVGVPLQAVQVVPGFQRFEIEGEATINDSVQAVVGTIWDIQTKIKPLSDLDREQSNACQYRDIVLLCFAIPPNGIIENLQEKRETAQAYCPFSPVMVLGIWPSKSSSRKASVDTSRKASIDAIQPAAYNDRLAAALTGGAIAYIECSGGTVTWRENVMSIFIGYVAARKFGSKSTDPSPATATGRRRSITVRSRSRDKTSTSSKGFRNFFK